MKLPRILEQHIVTKTVLEFDFVADNPNDGMTRLRVTVDAQGVTVHDQWDASASDFTVPWDDLRRWKYHTDQAETWAREMKIERETLAALRREAECEVIPIRGGTRCMPPPCSSPTVALGAARDSCNDEWPLRARWRPRVMK